MSDVTRTARRYHWLSESVTSFVNEPHEAICSDLTAPTLNLVAAEHEPLRVTSVELAAGSPERVISLVRRAGAGLKTRPNIPHLPFDDTPSRAGDHARRLPTLDMPRRHELRDVDPRRLESVLLTTYERPPQDFETLPGMEGVCARTLHAMAHAKVDRSDKLAALKRLGRSAKRTEPGQKVRPEPRRPRRARRSLKPTNLRDLRFLRDLRG